MIAGNKGSGTESRDNRPVNQTSDGSCDMESNETNKSVKNVCVKIKEESNMDDTCTYGTSNCDVTGFIGQLSDYPSDNSGKRNLDEHSELRSAFRDDTDYAVCIKYEPNASELETDPVASVNGVNPGKSRVQTKDYYIEPEEARNKLSYHDHPDHGQLYHYSPDNSHYSGGDGKNAFYNLQNEDTQINDGPVNCEIPENPTQKNTVPYTDKKSGNTGHNHHDHNHIFSISYEKINGSEKNDNSTEQQYTTRKVFKCDICSYIITMYTCNVCNYSTDESSRLVIHQRKHTGKFKCDVCRYSATSSYSLRTHKKKHKTEKPFKCDVCSYSTYWSSTLKKHKTIHTGEKPYKCDLCSYSTSHSGYLSVHRRIHTGEKPYKCDVCNYSASQSCTLSAHKRKHTGEKPYKCDVCNYRTDRPYHLAKHKQKHTGENPDICDVCSYTTAYISNMRSHKRRRIGEKQYKCDVCSYSTNWSHNLVIHKRKHTGVKPYMFDHCYCKQSAVA